MRLFVFWPDHQYACTIREVMESQGWNVALFSDGRQVQQLDGACDVMLLHLCLPGLDGLAAGDRLAAAMPLQPPRILFAAPAEWCVHRPFWADCTVECSTDVISLCHLISILAKKPLPKLAAAAHGSITDAVERFLDELSDRKRTKGRACAAWMLARMIPAVSEETLSALYAGCAQAFSSTPEAVERCVRVMVESVFTQGNMDSIERYFGATVDPERGKPTNRAFLMQAVQLLRMQLAHSRATARSLNSSVMDHSPAAPTSE